MRNYKAHFLKYGAFILNVALIKKPLTVKKKPVIIKIHSHGASAIDEKDVQMLSPKQTSVCTNDIPTMPKIVKVTWKWYFFKIKLLPLTCVF